MKRGELGLLSFGECTAAVLLPMYSLMHAQAGVTM